MSVLNTIKDYFGFGAEPTQELRPLPPTLEERQNAAAADRGYALGLVEDALEALRDSREEEHAISQELVRRAVQGEEDARRRAEELLRAAAERAQRLSVDAVQAERNAADDDYAVHTLQRLLVTVGEDEVPDGS